MTRNEYDQLYRLLNKLQTEAPCHNRACVGHMNCEYGVNGCYGEECAIKVVQEVASMMEWQEQEEDYTSLMTHERLRLI